MFIQNFTCFSTSIFLSKNRQGNVNSFCIVQFSRSSLNSVVVISFRRLCYYITSFRVCQEVFQTFFEFFLIFLVSDVISEVSRSLFASLSIISYLFEFVKRFFKIYFWISFQTFKIWFNSLSLLSKQLIYYITLFSICQEVFQTFLKFFLDFRSLCDVFKPFSRQLLYYTLFVRKSQPLFQK